jgi:hypothetical protein
VTTYAEVQGETLLQYPFTFASLQAENPYTNYGDDGDFVAIYPNTDYARANGSTLQPVTVAAQPSFDPLSQTCAQDAAPTLVGDVWTLGWTIAAMTAAQQQAAAIAAAEAAYAAAIAAGIQITSTSSPALNGSYAIDQTAQDAMTEVVTGIADGEGLPGGGATFIYPDASGAPHTFTAAQFTTFAVVVRNYVYALDLFVEGQGEMPSPSATIA